MFITGALFATAGSDFCFFLLDDFFFLEDFFFFFFFLEDFFFLLDDFFFLEDFFFFFFFDCASKESPRRNSPEEEIWNPPAKITHSSSRNNSLIIISCNFGLHRKFKNFFITTKHYLKEDF